jgi:hypothetical protein
MAEAYTHVNGIRNAYRILVGNLERKDHFGD